MSDGSTARHEDPTPEDREPEDARAVDDAPASGSGPRPGAGASGPGTPHAHAPQHTHAGNGTVNDGRDDQRPDGLDSDEAELRRLLQQAVSGVEPGDGTLEYLRQAVPARRARKRQFLVGVAAAALFAGTAVPALVHVSGGSGSDADPSAVGHASQAQGGTGMGKDRAGGEHTAGGPSDRVESTDRNDPGDRDERDGSTGSTTGAGEDPAPPTDTPTRLSVCVADQLSPAVASVTAPETTGTVYGTFRVTNVSTARCTVDGPGSVNVVARGAALVGKVNSTRHVAGDAAPGLPDPSLEAARQVLEPGAAYEVRFGWVPSETCTTPGDGTGGGTGGPSTTPTPSGDPTNPAGSSTDTDSGTTGTQPVGEDGGTEGSVAVTYTASTGSGTATATVNNACAGTVYWTGLLTPVG